MVGGRSLKIGGWRREEMGGGGRWTLNVRVGAMYIEKTGIGQMRCDDGMITVAIVKSTHYAIFRYH